jgi:hypothetical protein
MAQFKSTTFGKIKGQYGEAVATTLKNSKKNYLRVASVPSDPKTPKQIENRGKFGYVNHAMRSFDQVFKITFGGSQGMHHGVSVAFKKAVIGNNPDFSIDYTKLEFTDGALYQTNQVSAQKTTGTSVKIDWNYSKMAGNNPLDMANIICYNKDDDQAVLDLAVATRESATFTIELPEIWIGGNIHCWIYFSSPDDLVNSISQYINEVQL